MPFPHLSVDKLRAAWSTRLPLLLFAIKSALAAGLSWAVVSSLIGVEPAAFAVVSAVVVVQVTSWQTIIKSMERILGVIIGVSLAALIAHFLGLNFWTIAIMIFFAQVMSLFLQRRGQSLAIQIPTSAALSLVLGATSTYYPFLRVLGAIIGGFIGTVISLFFSPPIYVFKTRDAVAEVMTKVADTIPRLAAALAMQLNAAESREVYTSILELDQQVLAAQNAYSLGIDSTRLNLWARRARRLLVGYPEILKALDRLVRKMRRIAYTINEPETAWSELTHKQTWVLAYAGLLEEVGSILRSIAAYISSADLSQSNDLPDSGANLRIRVEYAQQQLRNWQEQLAQDTKQIEIQTANAESSSITLGYRLAIHGAILTDLRRMLDEVLQIVALTSQPSLYS